MLDPSLPPKMKPVDESSDSITYEVDARARRVSKRTHKHCFDVREKRRKNGKKTRPRCTRVP